MQKLFFVLVLAALLVVVEPLVGHQLVDGQRHQAGENGIAGVLGRRGQDRAVEIVGRDVVVAAQQGADRAPLVVAEVVDQQQRGLGILVCHREDLRPHERMRHDRGGFVALVDPVVVVPADELAELLIGFVLLVFDDLLDTLVGRIGELDLPVRDPAIDVAPVGEAVGHLECRGEASEFRPVIGCGLFGDQLLGVDVLLDREQHLVGIHGFDEVVGDLRPDGLVHDVLLLALGDHDDRSSGAYFLDFRQGFESCHTRHHLVQDDEVVVALRRHVDRVVSVVAGIDFVTFSPEEKHMGFQ